MGRVTKEQAAKNRQTVVEGTARLFQQHGLNGIGIAEMMAQAGLTHGGFYRQFASRDEVAGAACAHAMSEALASWQSTAGKAAPGETLRAIAEAYLTADVARHKCPMPVLAADVAREAPASPVREAFTGGVAALAEALIACAPEPEASPARRQRALSLLAAMVGAVTLARSIDDTALAGEILNAVRQLAAEA